MHTPAGSPRGNHASGRRPDVLGDILGDTVGDMLFGDGPAASAPLMGFPTTAAAVASAKPPRSAPPKPPRSPPSGIPPSPPPSPKSASPSPSSSSSSGPVRRPVSLPPVHRPPLPKQKAEKDPVRREPLSPIEMVAAEVPPRPPRRPLESPPESPKAADAFEHSPTRHSTAATAAAAVAASAAANPWLPARMQTGAAVHPPPIASPASSYSDAAAPVGGASAPGWLGEEWADAEDEDDGLVVMLKARIENLQGQLARFTNS